MCDVGRGDDGRLGHGDNGWKYVPRAVEELIAHVHIIEITCGSYHTAAVADDGRLFTWGGGMYGKLGHGHNRGCSSPTLVEALLNKHVLHVACGSRHTYALADVHDVFSWGDTMNGVSGLGSDVEGHQVKRTTFHVSWTKTPKRMN